MPLAVGCATWGAAPDHDVEGGPAHNVSALPPGPWRYDAAAATRACGEGGGLLLTQSLAQHGYPVVATAATTQIELRCRWSAETVEVWVIDTPRAQGRCVEPDVPVLDAALEVHSQPYTQGSPATLASARFTGRARLDADPPHRGCHVVQEPRRELLARAVRSLVERLPEGAGRGGTLVAPPPADGDVVVGEAGPGRKVRPERKSIYPIDVGELPVPNEAGGFARTPGRSAAARQADGADPEMRVRPKAMPGPVDRTFPRLWKDFGLAIDLGGGGCTNHCDELFAAGLGAAAHLLVHVHDLVAIDAGLSWVDLGVEDRGQEDGARSASLLGVDAGVRFYLRPPGGPRPYAGLGLSQVAVGGAEGVSDRQRGAHFLGLGVGMRAGVTWPVWGPFAAGVFVRYALLPWDRQCGRVDAWSLAGSGCTAVDDSDPISGSDVWTAGTELGIRFE